MTSAVASAGQWIDLLTETARSLRGQLDPLGRPNLTSVAYAYRLVWATEGAVQATTAGGELWWLRLAETVIQTSAALGKIPAQTPVPVILGGAPTATAPLLDSPQLRDAAYRLLDAGRSQVATYARHAHQNYRALVWHAIDIAHREPVDIQEWPEALALAQARARLYRTVSRLTDRYIDAATAAGGTGPSGLALQLRADLAGTLDATRDILDLPQLLTERPATATTMSRIATWSSIAWDDLIIDPAAASWTSPADTATWLVDAARLSAHLAAFDSRWEHALLAGSDHLAPAEISRILRWQVLPDIRAVQRLGIQTYARDVAATATTVPATATPSPPAQITGGQAPAALDSYLTHLTGTRSLLIPHELRQLASAAARLSAVVGHDDHTYLGTQTTQQTVAAWRRVHHVTHPLQHTSPPETGYAQGYRLAAWADNELAIQHPRPAEPASARSAAGGDMTATYAAVARRLPELADAALTQLRALDQRQALRTLTLVPAEPTSAGAGHQHPAEQQNLTYIPTPASAALVSEVTIAFAAAQASSARLSRTLHVNLTGNTAPAGRPATAEERTASPGTSTPDRATPDPTSRRYDITWVKWHIRQAVAAPHTPPTSPTVAQPALQPGHDDMLQLIAAIGGDALAHTLAEDPAVAALQAALRSAHDDGHNLPILLAAATQRTISIHASPAATLLGRLRRLPTDFAISSDTIRAPADLDSSIQQERLHPHPRRENTKAPAVACLIIPSLPSGSLAC